MALTRAQSRDLIRHNLNKHTSQDEFEDFITGGNVLGDPSGAYPWPSNRMINEQLDLAVNMVNQKCALGHVQDVEIAVAATTSNGPQEVNLRTVTSGSLHFGDINEVRRATFDTGGNNFRLIPLIREEFDRDTLRPSSDQFLRWNTPWGFREWQELEPSVPEWYWMEGYSLFLLSGSSAGGTLHIIAGTGIPGFADDGDTLDVLPTDHHKAVWDIATALLAGTQHADPEMSEAEQKFMAKGMDGIREILDWKRNRNASVQPTIGIVSNRQSAEYRWQRRQVR